MLKMIVTILLGLSSLASMAQIYENKSSMGLESNNQESAKRVSISATFQYEYGLTDIVYGFVTIRQGQLVFVTNHTTDLTILGVLIEDYQFSATSYNGAEYPLFDGHHSVNGFNLNTGENPFPCLIDPEPEISDISEKYAAEAGIEMNTEPINRCI